MICAIVAPGESMSQALADSVRHLPTIVVSNAYELRPDAMALVANDAAWWRAYQQARTFAGRKFSVNRIDGVEQVTNAGLLFTGSNSGAVAIHVAVQIFQASKVLLFGFDCTGTHYYGIHKPPLRNTTPARYEIFKRQFADIGHAFKGKAQIVNCNPYSALQCFPKLSLEEALA